MNKTLFYQSASNADYSRRAQAEGAAPEFAGPTEEGWYLLDEDEVTWERTELHQPQE